MIEQHFKKVLESVLLLQMGDINTLYACPFLVMYTHWYTRCVLIVYEVFITSVQSVKKGWSDMLFFSAIFNKGRNSKFKRDTIPGGKRTQNFHDYMYTHLNIVPKYNVPTQFQEIRYSWLRKVLLRNCYVLF